MKKVFLMATLVGVLMSLTACMGTRGHVGDKEICENSYFLGVFSISEIIAPCSPRPTYEYNN